MGIEIEILEENPFITFTRKDTSDGMIDIILVHFNAKRIGDIKPGVDIREWNWFDLQNLPENLGPNIVPALRHFGYFK